MQKRLKMDTKILRCSIVIRLLHSRLRSIRKKIDVNVHPSKMELRFSNQQGIYNLLYEAISKGLHEPELIPEVEMSEIKVPECLKKTGKENCYKRCGKSISDRWHFTQDAKEFRSGGSRAKRNLVAVRDAVEQNFRHR